MQYLGVNWLAWRECEAVLHGERVESDAMLANNITVLYIRDMLLEYIFLHFEPTRSVYEFGIFTYGPIYPSLSLPYRFRFCRRPEWSAPPWAHRKKIGLESY